MAAPLPPGPTVRHRAIVLVHGAWVGEWCWLPVLPYLTAAGRPVYTVSLTGHGTRRHESGPHVTLGNHVADVLAVLDTYDLDDVTLVGHSYGGRVITPAALAAARRLAALVYLDAHAPVADDPGQPPDRHATAAANGGMLPFQGYEHDVDLLLPAAREWFLERIAEQSFATFTDPWQVELPPDVRKTFVYASANPGSRFTTYAEASAADPAWQYHELPGPHFLMFSHPEEVAEIILGA
jgi:pimeloyl-ACP methyl ester carboxylesterase